MAQSSTMTMNAGHPGELYYRHRLPVRIMHWINVVCLSVLFMSGLNIFNAHPSLNWGRSSYSGVPPFLEIGAKMSGQRIIGVTRIGSHEFETTGALGAFQTDGGETDNRAFPSWLTIPGTQWLSMARRWHFFFAWLFVINGLAYLGYAIASRHLSRDLAPTRQDWRTIGRSIVFPMTTGARSWKSCGRRRRGCRGIGRRSSRSESTEYLVLNHHDAKSSACNSQPACRGHQGDPTCGIRARFFGAFESFNPHVKSAHRAC